MQGTAISAGAGLTPTRWTANCAWVPGTDDLVRVGGAGREAVLSLQQVRELAGRPVLDDLYLSGQARFECDLALWRAIETLAAARAGR